MSSVSTTPTMASAVQAAAHTLTQEAQALNALAQTLPTDPAIPAALQLMQQAVAEGGRVIVTGVGKSGHIGGKIAATLASTGTPAFFIHPTEALHGDLGMLTPRDVVVALSHSGESVELAATLSYCTRFAIPLIALTGAKSVVGGSTLAKAAQVVLNTGVQQEACPLNLAPTTSTTAALALADALAVALMHLKGFSKTDFAQFHPGGKLGAQLKRVQAVMLADNLPLLPHTATLAETLHLLAEANQSCVGFTDAAGKLVGIFTEGDLKRLLLRTATLDTIQTAEYFMHPHPRTIAPDAMATAAVASMDEHRITCLWVVNDAHHPVGLIRLSHCVHAGLV
jgi:arabinose-5-phosphate isomerase